MLSKRHNLCDICHEYTAFELQLRVLVDFFFVLLVFLIFLVPSYEPVLGLIRIKLFAAQKDALEKVNCILLVA